MYKYFKTKAQAKREELENKKKKAAEKVKKDKEAKEKAWVDRLLNIREASKLNETYRTLRYFLPVVDGGNVSEYAKKYANQYMRFDRIMYLEEEITKHDPEKQAFIDTILSKRN